MKIVVLTPAVIECSITDHYPIMVFISCKLTFSSIQSKYVRSLKKLCIENFNTDLQIELDSLNFDIFNATFTNINAVFDKFYSAITKTIDKHAQSKSNLASIEYGVPQGSILGPLLFLVFINDLPAALKTTPRFFADDTVLLATEKIFSDLEKLVNSELHHLNRWMSVNALTVHPKKKCVMSFRNNSSYLRDIK